MSMKDDLKPRTRVRYKKSDQQSEPKDNVGTILDYYEETPAHPFRATAMVRWDSGWVDDDVDPDELEVIS